MRFDPTEVNDDNLDAFGRYLTGNEVGVKIQALQALAMLGEFAGKKVDAVARLLGDKDAPIQLTVQTIQVLMAMGYTAKPALPDLRKLMDETKKGLEKKKGQDKQNDEDLVKLIEAAIKRIEEAKPTSPAVEPKK